MFGQNFGVILRIYVSMCDKIEYLYRYNKIGYKNCLSGESDIKYVKNVYVRIESD